MSRWARFKNLFTKKGRSINRSVDEINTAIKDVKKYNATYNTISQGLAIVEKSPISFSDKSLETDLRKNIKNIKNRKYRKDAVKNIKDIAAAAKKTAANVKKQTGMVTKMNVTVDILLSTRTSVRYSRMAESASEQGAVDDEEDFFLRTVRQSINTFGYDKKEFLSKLNPRLEEMGYMQIAEYLI